MVALITKLRRERGLRQQDVADHLKLSRRQWQRIESGDRGIRLRDLEKLWELLGVKVLAVRKEEI